MDIDNKLSIYCTTTGIIKNMFRPQKTLKKTGIQLYNILAIPALIHGSENCTTKAKDPRRKTATEMKYEYMRKTAGSTWTDHKTVTEIARELNTTRFGQNKGLQKPRINKMPRTRLPRITKHYRPRGKRKQGRPLTLR